MRLLAGLVASLFACAAWAATQVEVFTPQGQAKGVRQVAVRFSEPMVAFGDPRLADPFTVRCEGDAERLKGRGRWADPKNWLYDFDADLPAGQRCQFTLERGPEVGCRAAGRRAEGIPVPYRRSGGADLAAARGQRRHRRGTGFPARPRRPGRPGELQGRVVRGLGHQRAHPAQAAVRRRRRASSSLPTATARTTSFARIFKGRRMVPIARFKVEDKRFAELPVVGGALRAAAARRRRRSGSCWGRRSPRRRASPARRRSGLPSRCGRLSS